MQASTLWQPPTGTLGEILAETRRRVSSIDERPSTPARRGERPTRPFAAALRRGDVTVIAEVKRRSPSKGDINPALDPAALAAAYERGGAAAVSVLTEPSRFGGSQADLRAVAAAVGTPVLKKDFHIDAAQLTEAVEGGASAVLLIARAVPPGDLIALARHARALGLEPLIEVRTESELEAALAADAAAIGVNSRDLETLEVDERVPERLIPMVPRNVVAVWESGVRGSADVRRAADAGADAVLVGSALSRAAEPERLLRELTGIARRPRG